MIGEEEVVDELSENLRDLLARTESPEPPDGEELDALLAELLEMEPPEPPDGEELRKLLDELARKSPAQ